MATVTVIAGIVNTLNKVIITRLLELGTRLHITSENKLEWKKLTNSYKTFADGITHYESAIKAALASDEFLSILEEDELKILLGSLNNIIRDAESKLPSLESRLDQGISGAASVSAIALKEDQSPGRKKPWKNLLWRKSSNIITEAPVIAYANRDQETIEKLNKCLENARSELREGRKLIEDKFGIFKAYFKSCVRGNNVYLDYGHGEQDDASHEAKLKHALLNPSVPSSSLSYPPVPHTICVEGQGGMGKTTVLKDICSQEDVRGKFADGIHFISIGEGANEELIMKEISRCLNNAGFRAVGLKMKDEGSLEDATWKVSKILQERRLLIVVDDWHPDHVKYLKYFQAMLYKSKNGVLLVSSRCKQISSQCDEVLHFTELEPLGVTSRKILLKQYGGEKLSENGDGDMKEATDKILSVCGGIKLCLAIAGNNILLRGGKGDRGCDRVEIKRYAEALKRNFDEVITDPGAEENRTFLKVVVTSLEYCNREIQRLRIKNIKGEIVNGTAARTAKYLFKGLCVFEKQKPIPIEAISRLWNINGDDVVQIVRKLRNYNLMNIDENEKWIAIHDKVMDVAGYLAKEGGSQEVREWHERILRGYLPFLENGFCATRNPGRSDCEPNQERINWGVISCPRRWKLGEELGYFIENVCRHLLHAGKLEELWNLVTNVWWTLRRKEHGGLVGLISDFKILKGLCDEANVAWRGIVEMKPKFSRNEEVGVEILINHIRNAWVEIRKDIHVIGYEMFGRVSKEDQRYKVVEQFLGSIEKEGPSPWLQPLTAGLSYIDRRQIGEMTIQKDIEGGSVTPECGFVVCQFAKGFEIVDVESQERYWFPVGNDDNLLCTSICSDPLRVASGFECGKLIVWDVKKGEQITNTFVGQNESVGSVALSKGGNRVACGCNNSVQVWDVVNGKQIWRTFIGDNDWFRCVAMSEDCKAVASGGDDGIVRVWNLDKDKQARKAFTGHVGKVYCVDISKDGKVVISGGMDGSVRVWDVDKCKQFREALRPFQRIRCIRLSGDGTRVVYGGEDGTVSIWDLKKDEQVGEALTGHGIAVKCLGINEDGNRVVSGALDGTVRVWDLQQCKLEKDILPSHNGVVQCVAVNRHGTKLVSGGRDGNIGVFDTRNGKQTAEFLNAHRCLVRCITLSEDGSRVISGGDDKIIRVWDLQKGQQVGNALTGHSGRVEFVAMSADGTRLMSGGWSNTARVWDLEKCEQIGEALVGHTDWVMCGAMTRDGSRVVSGGDDGTVRVWDVEKSEQIGPSLVGHRKRVKCVGFIKGDRQVVSGGRDRTVRVWDIRSSSQIGESFHLKGWLVEADPLSCISDVMRVEYEKWLGIIRLSVAEQDEVSKNSICMKTLNESICPIMEKLGISLFNVPIRCDCDECNCEIGSEVEAVDENDSLILWVKEDKGIYVNTPQLTKVGRVENVWCIKDRSTIAVGLRNGRVMICNLRL